MTLLQNAQKIRVRNNQSKSPDHSITYEQFEMAVAMLRGEVRPTQVAMLLGHKNGGSTSLTVWVKNCIQKALFEGWIKVAKRK